MTYVCDSSSGKIEIEADYFKAEGGTVTFWRNDRVVAAFPSAYVHGVWEKK